MTKRTFGDEGIQRIRATRGMLRRIADGLAMDDWSVSRWETVPIERVFQVARITGIDPIFLRPDFFAGDPLRERQANRIRQARREAKSPQTPASGAAPRI